MIRSTALCTQFETVYEQLLHIMGIDDGLVIPELKFKRVDGRGLRRRGRRHWLRFGYSTRDVK